MSAKRVNRAKKGQACRRAHSVRHALKLEQRQQMAHLFSSVWNHAAHKAGCLRTTASFVQCTSMSSSFASAAQLSHLREVLSINHHDHGHAVTASKPVAGHHW